MLSEADFFDYGNYMLQDTVLKIIWYVHFIEKCSSRQAPVVAQRPH